VLLSCHQNAGQNHDIKIAKRFFENLAQFKYLGTKQINQGKSKRLNSGNACYYSVQGRYGLNLSGSGEGPVEGSCEHGNELSVSIKYWKILE
jgi:hypothetical protein